MKYMRNCVCSICVLKSEVDLNNIQMVKTVVIDTKVKYFFVKQIVLFLHHISRFCLIMKSLSDNVVKMCLYRRKFTILTKAET